MIFTRTARECLVNSATGSPWTLSCLPSSTTKTQDSWGKGETAQERHTRLPSITQAEKKYSKAAAVWVPRRQHSLFPRPTPSEKKIGGRNLYLSNPEPVRMARQARKPEEETGRSRFCEPVTVWQNSEGHTGKQLQPVPPARGPRTCSQGKAVPAPPCRARTGAETVQRKEMEDGHQRAPEKRIRVGALPAPSAPPLQATRGPSPAL